MDHFVLENPLSVEYSDSMEGLQDFWGNHSFDPVMDTLHEDDSMQTCWPVGLGINLAHMEHDGELSGNDTALVVLHDRLITDASDAAKSDLFNENLVDTRNLQRRELLVSSDSSIQEKSKETTKDKPTIVTTLIQDDGPETVSQISHFINGSLTFPPTPPSSVSSDNEGCRSPARETLPASNKSRLGNAGDLISVTNHNRMYLGIKVKPDQLNSSRHPINSPLISYQPKGSTGTIQLTEEEKRTLVAEGFPIPTKLPLTKTEERSLKKIRRKIKNKISAQESRRKKKEYMDTLEQRSQLLVDENISLRERLHKLESDNTNLRTQLTRLQKLINGDTEDLLIKSEIVQE